MRTFKYVLLFFFLILLKIGDAFARLMQRIGRVVTFLFLLPFKTLRYAFRSVSRRTPSKSAHARRKKKKQKKKADASPPLKIKYFLIGTLTSLVFLFLPLLMFVYLQELPNPRELSERQVAQTTKIYDRKGILLYQVYASQNRTVVPLSTIPKSLQDATLAIEDKNFYHHPGFDVVSMGRAFWSNVSGGNFQGGSTITQQLIKSSMFTPEPSYVRKIKEVILAFWAERIYTKQEILEMYFNQIPYGGTSWGAEAASEVYFGKTVDELSLAESAFLAGITSAPSAYSPYGPDASLWKRRQEEVLSRMVALGYITTQQKNTAKNEQLVFRPPQTAIKAPHFVEYVRDVLTQKYGLAMLEKGGLSITTSLDMSTQDMAQKVVADEVAKESYLNLSNGAALVTNPENGDILAMVGSKDYYDENGGKVNITTSLRQPGSSIKVVTYSSALSQGFTAASILDDTPVTYSLNGAEPYSPVNYDGRYRGRVPLRLALANSLNIPAVKLLNQIGIPSMVNLGKQMGISSWKDPKEYGLSITLGGAEVRMVEMAEVFGTLANSGEHIELNPILKVTDSKGHVLEEKTRPEGTKALDSGVAFIISDILRDNAARSSAFGPNSPLNIPGHSVSVKTGTTDYKRDNWTIGYTKNLLTAVWVGNNDNTPMSPTLASGITGAAPIWSSIMTNLLQKNPEPQMEVPQNVVQKSCLGRNEYFIKGTENSALCGRNALTPPPPNATPTPNQERFFRRFDFRR